MNLKLLDLILLLSILGKIKSPQKLWKPNGTVNCISIFKKTVGKITVWEVIHCRDSHALAARMD